MIRRWDFYFSLSTHTHTHTKANLQSMLRCLSRTGLKLGGKLADKKSVLAERVAVWLNQVVEAGREVPREDLDGEELSVPSDGGACLHA